MKKIWLIIFLAITLNSSYANLEECNVLRDGSQIVYDVTNETWDIARGIGADFIFTKKYYDGVGGYTQFFNSLDKVEFTLNSDFEFIKDNQLIAIDNDELKYFKIVYDGENFVEELLTYDEIQNLFPNAEIIHLSQIDEDNKMWLHKPFLKKKEILFVNDSNKFYHKLTPKDLKAQHDSVKGANNNFSLWNLQLYSLWAKKWQVNDLCKIRRFK